MPKKKSNKKVKKATRRPKKAPRKAVSGRKAAKRRKPRRKPIFALRELHAKKLEILEAVPIMPCSVLGRDWQGSRFAHTQAERVYQIYREECTKRKLVIRRVKGETSDCKISDWDSKGNCVERTGTLFQGVWEIRDNDTGETEEFGGSGQGLNGVWSANSAQTVAKKQALLDYFETAWPQPTDHLKVIRESLAAVPDAEKVEAYKQIFGSESTTWSIMTATGAVKKMEEFYRGEQKCQKSKTKSK